MDKLTLEVGNKLLVANIGGGTSYIVVQEVVIVDDSEYKVKEVTMNSRGLCGGTYVDSWFKEFIEGKISILKHLNMYGQLMMEWECTKSYFDCSQSITTMNVPNKLIIEWERPKQEIGSPNSRSQSMASWR